MPRKRRKIKQKRKKKNKQIGHGLPAQFAIAIVEQAIKAGMMPDRFKSKTWVKGKSRKTGKVHIFQSPMFSSSLGGLL